MMALERDTARPETAAPETAALPRRAAGKRAYRALAALADPRVRVVIGVAGMVASALPVRSDRVGTCERRLFQAVNGLPDALYLPAWVIMQLGTLGAAPAAAGTAWLAGDRRLAWRLAAGGSATWVLAKIVKARVRRPRPSTLVPGARCRGPAASGLGYLSGHAGVAVALGAATCPRLGPAGRAITLGLMPAVGLSRAYVGAHLPLDIAGGAALGFTVEAAVALAQRAAAPPARLTGDGRRTECAVPHASAAVGYRSCSAAPDTSPGGLRLDVNRGRLAQ